METFHRKVNKPEFPKSVRGDVTSAAEQSCMKQHMVQIWVYTLVGCFNKIPQDIKFIIVWFTV